MSQQLDQSQISRRFHVAFKTGGDEILNYDCAFDSKDDKGNTTKGPHSAEAALMEFHKYMQKTRKVKPHEYVITGLYDTYADIKREQVKRVYNITQTSNPDLTPPPKKEPEPFTMFDEAQIKEQSKLAEMRFAQ